MFGLAVTSVNNSTLGTATFDNVQITGTSGAVSGTSALFANWAEGHSLGGPALDPMAAPANDGIANLLKFAFNMDPTLADAQMLTPGSGTSGLPVYGVSGSGAASIFRIEFVRRIGTGLEYRPKKSTDLMAWENLNSTATVTPIDADWERVVHEEPFDGSSITQMFGTVEVSLP
jgi:hypothetical protein